MVVVNGVNRLQRISTTFHSASTYLALLLLKRHRPMAAYVNALVWK